ncbi:uncharacterized protein METZ01_LOCUS118952, partial [marine metagenome]
MDLEYGLEYEEFREKVKKFVKENENLN